MAAWRSLVASLGTKRAPDSLADSLEELCELTYPILGLEEKVSTPLYHTDLFVNVRSQ